MPKGEGPDFKWLLDESNHLASLINVPRRTIYQIYKSDTDWEFVLKVDALLEACVKKVVKVALTANEMLEEEKIESFVDGLPIRGRNSALNLLSANGCEKEELELI